MLLRLTMVLKLGLMVMALGCDRGYGPPEPEGTMLGSPKVNLDTMEVQSLPDLEGPYIFIEAKAPNRIVLTDTKAQTEEFELIGIQVAPYPAAPKLDDKGKAIEPTEEETEARVARNRELREFTAEALKEYCGDRRLYLSRLSDWKPSLIYLFLPDTPATLNDPVPHGKATLINAWLLRQGSAFMYLEGERHPFHEQMLDCQIRAIREAGKPGMGRDIRGDFWGKYDLEYPEQPIKARMEAMEEYL